MYSNKIYCSEVYIDVYWNITSAGGVAVWCVDWIIQVYNSIWVNLLNVSIHLQCKWCGTYATNVELE